MEPAAPILQGILDAYHQHRPPAPRKPARLAEHAREMRERPEADLRWKRSTNAKLQWSDTPDDERRRRMEHVREGRQAA